MVDLDVLARQQIRTSTEMCEKVAEVANGLRGRLGILLPSQVGYVYANPLFLQGFVAIPDDDVIQFSYKQQVLGLFSKAEAEAYTAITDSGVTSRTVHEQHSGETNLQHIEKLSRENRLWTDETSLVRGSMASASSAMSFLLSNIVYINPNHLGTIKDNSRIALEFVSDFKPQDYVQKYDSFLKNAQAR